MAASGQVCPAGQRPPQAESACVSTSSAVPKLPGLHGTGNSGWSSAPGGINCDHARTVVTVHAAGNRSRRERLCDKPLADGIHLHPLAKERRDLFPRARLIGVKLENAIGTVGTDRLVGTRACPTACVRAPG